MDLATSLFDDWQLALKHPDLTLRHHYEYTFNSKQQACRCARPVSDSLLEWLATDHQAELASNAALELGLKYLTRHSDVLAQAARDGDDLSSSLREVAGRLAPQLAALAVSHWARPPSQEPGGVEDFAVHFEEWRQMPLYAMPDGTLQSHDQRLPET